jgi:hypothetical protein
MYTDEKKLRKNAVNPIHFSWLQGLMSDGEKSGMDGEKYLDTGQELFIIIYITQ